MAWGKKQNFTGFGKRWLTSARQTKRAHAICNAPFRTACGGLGREQRYRFGQAFDGIVLVILNFGLVFDDLPVELVDQGVDRRVQVFGDASSVQIFSSQSQGDL